MPKSTSNHIRDARFLTRKHQNAGDGSRYAVHRAAEVEAWDAFRKNGDEHVVGVAITIGEMFHNPAAFESGG